MPLSHDHHHPTDENKAPLLEVKRSARWLGFLQSIAAGEWLILLASSVQVIAGLMLTGLAISGKIEPLWLSGICNMMGCASTMLGGFQFYDVVRRHRHGGHVLHEALNRMLKDQN